MEMNSTPIQKAINFNPKEIIVEPKRSNLWQAEKLISPLSKFIHVMFFFQNCCKNWLSDAYCDKIANCKYIRAKFAARSSQQKYPHIEF